MDSEFILKVKEELNKTSWDFKRKEIIRNAVKELRNKGYSDNKIRELFKIQSLKEQDNTQMIDNNSRYLELLNDVLNS
jgi:hypothetical protein